MAESSSSYDKYRADLADFRADMSRYEANMAQFREELRTDMQELRTELRTGMANLELRLVRWLLIAAAVGGLIGGLIAAVARLVR